MADAKGKAGGNGQPGGTQPAAVRPVTARQREVLAAAEVCQVAGAVNAGDIARAIGDDQPGGANRVNQIITGLRNKGLWPYRALHKGLDPQVREALVRPAGDLELAVLGQCFALLASLGPAERQRVFGYLRERLEGEAAVADLSGFAARFPARGPAQSSGETRP